MNTSMDLHSFGLSLRTCFMIWVTPVCGQHPAGCAWWTLKQRNTQGLVFPWDHLTWWESFELAWVGRTRSRPEARRLNFFQDHKSLSHPSCKAPIWIGFLSWWVSAPPPAISILGGGATSGFRNFQNVFIFYKKDPMNINNIYYVDCVCLRKVPPVFHSRRQEAVDVSSLQSGSVCRFFPVSLSANHFHAFLHFLRYKKRSIETARFYFNFF